MSQRGSLHRPAGWPPLPPPHRRHGQGLAWGLLAVLAALAVAVLLSGCGGKRHLATAEDALAGYQLLHWRACLEAEPLLPAEDCERHLARLRTLETGLEAWYAERAHGLAGVLRVARPYAEAALRWLWPWIRDYLPGGAA